MSKRMGLDRMGRGFDPKEFESPIHVGPEEHDMKGGWEPSNPQVGEPHDPLGYIPGDK